MSRRAENENNVFALPWLCPSEYDMLRVASIYKTRLLPSTYERWRRAAEDTERRMASVRYAVIRVDVDLEKLRVWRSPEAAIDRTLS
jgi:hypothetical protein